MRCLAAFLAFWLAASPVLAGAPRAATLFKKGRKAESSGDLSKAYLLYSQAVALDPQNRKFWLAAQAIRGPAVQHLRVDAPVAAVPGGPAEPSLSAPASTLSAEELAEARVLLPPPRLRGPAWTRDFRLRGDSKSLFEQVAKEFGFTVIFDGDFQPGQPVSFTLDGANYQTALRALESVAGAFLVPLSETRFLVAKDTQQKRAELEPNVALLVPIPEPLTPQEVTEVVNGIRQLYDLTHVSVDTARRVIYLRDRVSRARNAERMLSQLMSHRAQVVVEVEVLSASSSLSRTYGMKLPNAYSLNWLTNKSFLRPTPLMDNIAGLLLFGGGLTLMGLGIQNAALFASASESQSRSMVKAEMRSLDGQTASLHIGDRYPIITLGYYGGPPDPKLKVYTPPPNITFEDLGIVLKVIPKVHDASEVSLDVEAEFKALAGAAANGIPVISNRKFKGVVRMRFDEAAVMAGLVGDGMSQSWSGIPVIAQLPPFRENNKSVDKSEILLVLRPRLVSLPPWETPVEGFWSGTETRALTAVE